MKMKPNSLDFDYDATWWASEKIVECLCDHHGQQNLFTAGYFP